MRRSSMAAERTWLAWWRTALAATAGALAVGRFAPTLLHVAAWPYVVLGCGYAGLAVGLLVVGARLQRELEASLRGDTHRPLGFMVLALAYRTGVPWNESAYSNKQFDELLAKAEGTLDVDARREILGELEKIMQEDGPISQPLWRSVYAAYDKRVKGYQVHPTLYIFGETLGIEAAKSRS